MDFIALVAALAEQPVCAIATVEHNPVGAAAPGDDVVALAGLEGFVAGDGQANFASRIADGTIEEISACSGRLTINQPALTTYRIALTALQIFNVDREGVASRPAIDHQLVASLGLKDRNLSPVAHLEQYNYVAG